MESQQTKTKPTPVEMAEQAMKDMKARIDLVRSHRAIINRLIQTTQGTNKPFFLLRNNEAEEAVLRKTRTELNLWIQAQRSGTKYVDPNYQEVVQASKDAEGLIRAQSDDGEDTVDCRTATRQVLSSVDQPADPRRIRHFYLDVRDYLLSEASHSCSEQERDEESEILWDYEDIPMSERFNTIVELTDKCDCDEFWCDDLNCWNDNTAIPNV